MIRAEQLTAIGKVFKPHGIKGELNVMLDYGVEPDELRCLILEIDGIFVPFFIESSRSRGSESWLIKMEGIDNETQAAALVNHEVYGLTDELDIDTDDDGVHLHDLVGFKLFDGDTAIGVIRRIDDSTENILMSVETGDGRAVLVPFAEDFISGLDPKAKIIEMNLPEGIMDLN